MTVEILTSAIGTVTGDIITKCVISQRNALLPNGKHKLIWLGFTDVKNKVTFSTNETTPAAFHGKGPDKSRAS
jgi:hypothetical protein